MRTSLTVFLSFFFLSVFSQYSIEGKVVDAADKQELAFVNIAVSGSEGGTSSGIDGKFSITVPSKNAELTFSYVGYKTLRYVPNGGEKHVLIRLEKQSYDLGEVEVKPGENPAHRIIRLALKNRPKHDPSNISSYTCETYSKTYYDLVFNDADMRTKQDSVSMDTAKKNFSAFRNSHVMLLESVTERDYLKPGLLNEKVTATKVSGFKDPSFSTSATDLQPFGFYEDYFRIIGKDYLNPISKGSTSLYFFDVKDTLFQGADTVFIIYYRPLKGKNFDALEGLLYINTNGYAIQNVIASPYEKGMIEVKVQQQYQLVDGKQWFPEQLNYELFYKHFPSKDIGMKLNGKGFIRNVKLDTPLKKKDFSYVTVSMEPDANKKDDAYWELHRKDTLDAKEKKTYQFIDSLGRAAHFDRSLHILEALTTFQLPVSIFNIDLNKIVGINEYETVRLGIGLHTNDKLSKWFSLGGYAGYGYADSVLKYGADLRVFLKRDSKEYYLKYMFSHDLAEPARSQYFYSRNNINRNLMTWRMDHVEQQELSLNARIFKHFVCNFALHQSSRQANYPYLFFPDVQDPTAVSTVFKSTEFRFKMKFAYKERLVKTLGQLISDGSDFPVVYLAYTKGFTTPGLGFYNYQKISLGIERSFIINHLGRSSVLLEGGYIDNNVPYPFLFHGNGSYDKGSYLYVNNSFQTMGIYEFLSDRYANLFYSHTFAAPFYRKPRSQPLLVIHTNIGFGSFDHKAQHSNFSYKTMEKGYYESGLYINNILRANYFNVAWLGIGGGLFYRYGPYASKDQERNLAYKVSFSLSF
jgi:hypothetical protein